MDYDDVLSGIFDRVQFVWDQGLFKEARLAYEQLLELLEKEDEYGYSLNRPDDFDEDMARYLRAIILTEKPGNRAKALLESMRRLQQEHGYYSTINLTAIQQVAQDELPDQSAFLNEWIDHLHGHLDDLSDMLLREAIGLRDGTAGLEKLAKQEGKLRPRAYVDWVAEFEKAKDFSAILNAGKTALMNLGDTPLRSEVADIMFRAAAAVKDAKQMKECRWEAFCAAPDLGRLMDLWEVQRTTKDKIAAMDKARKFVDHGKKKTDDDSTPACLNGESPCSPDRDVWVHSALLSGDWKSVWARAEKLNALGWSSSSHEQGMAVLAAMVWIHGKSIQLPPQLESLWRRQLRSGSYRFRSLDEDRSEVLESAYRTVIEANTWRKRDMTVRLNQCEGIVRQRVSVIVSNTHRGAYERAALLTVACAETFKCHGKSTDGDGLILEMRKAFPRHSSFQREMKNALAMKKG
ncbi:MAG: hypothetical protein HQL31_11990 [Planctomycetes bacterium]|nr:hypothetical protein [Planctomycetota bacterium]